MSDEDWMSALEARSKAEFDGHLTIMRFTTNWRVSFWQPSWREEIQEMPVGRTLAEAAQAALAGDGLEWMRAPRLSDWLAQWR